MRATRRKVSHSWTVFYPWKRIRIGGAAASALSCAHAVSASSKTVDRIRVGARPHRVVRPASAPQNNKPCSLSIAVGHEGVQGSCSTIKGRSLALIVHTYLDHLLRGFMSLRLLSPFIMFKMLLSLLFLCSLVSSRPQQPCRYMPTDSCCPSPDTWQVFNRTLGGKLILTKPLAQPCHNPEYDASKCQNLQNQWTNLFIQYVILKPTVKIVKIMKN